jgi:DNA-3-methyladenine glycosylase
MSADWLDILSAKTEDVAPRLLGSTLVRDLDGHCLRGRIVEVEAYNQTDLASHSYRGVTERTKVMFGKAGHLYVYFTYGMHYCCNVVTGPEGYGSGVLIRALEPLEGEERMVSNRGQSGVTVTNGPAKLCQALAINKQFNGHDLQTPPIKLEIGEALPQQNIVQTVRVGISQAKDVPWRFYIKNNHYVSKM